MRMLRDIISRLRVESVSGNLDIPVSRIVTDSRIAGPGDLFVAVKGTKYDGHTFIPQVVRQGVTTVVCESMPEDTSGEITWIKVHDSSMAPGMLASAFYGNPSRHLKVVGVTGTNGKTTTATLLYRLFDVLGYRVGLMSTICNYIGDKTFPATHTTPDPIQLQELLHQMVQENCTHCFMEVSSHAAHQNRIAGIDFSGAIFTNLTHDHLDYHQTFDNYLQAKKKFFDELPSSAFALVNKDDRNGLVMVQNTKAERKTYSLKSPSDFHARILESHMEGMLLKIDQQEVWTRLVGEFNAYNFLAVYAAAVLMGEESGVVLEKMSQMEGVRGRIERFRSPDGRMVVVDYAHTPDALKNVLETLLQIRGSKSYAIIGVIGAGGDRDKTKRPKMGRIAASLCDRLIVTSDNPRSEDPETIIEEIRSGIDSSDMNKVISIVNRAEAIRTACLMARPGDVILIAGKGHETYQEIKGIKYPFDDMKEVKKAFGVID